MPCCGVAVIGEADIAGDKDGVVTNDGTALVAAGKDVSADVLAGLGVENVTSGACTPLRPAADVTAWRVFLLRVRVAMGDADIGLSDSSSEYQLMT